MSEWIAIDRWHQCMQLERPGIIFEVVNGEGQELVTACVGSGPVPFDWRSRPTKFRPVPAPPPRRSSPIPEPAGQP